ncbi:MAG: glycosyltransferase [Candidatus Bathyarchaeota archaeon]|nr:glycosyltransferase [Candidatus Bathyarchaeota archaeon]
MLLPESLQLHNKKNFEFHYIYFLPWKDQMVENLKKAGGKVTCVEAKDNIRLILQYKNVVNYCKDHQIDLIHCHLPWAGFLGRIVHKMTSIPVLYTEHNMQERYHVVTKTINKFSFNAQTLAFGVSDDVTDSIIKNIHPKIPVRTLLNGVNTKNFVRTENDLARKELGIPSEGFVIGNVAVFRFQKRLVEWLQVFKKIKDRNPNVYGIIVGAGPLEEEVRTELHKLGLENHVFFPGLKTEVRPYFEAMDIFMMSSEFEGLPIALLEAMSMECAIVATKAGGIKEVIRNDKDGLTCEVENWNELSELCQNLINDPVKLKEMKKAARIRVVQSFSLRRMVAELENYYLDHALENKIGFQAIKN